MHNDKAECSVYQRPMLGGLVLLLGVGLSIGSAWAATSVTWNFTTQTGNNTSPYGTGGSPTNAVPQNGSPVPADTSATSTGSWGNTVTTSSTVSGTTYSATAQAWSSTGTPGNQPATRALGSATNGIYTQVSNTSNPLQTAYLAVYGGLGLGVNNRETTVEQFGTSPQHAISNEAGYDSVLFDFSTPTTLTSVTLGYPGTSSGCTYNGSSCDSDVVVLEWLGSGAPDLTTTPYASMNTGTSNWKLVGNTISNAAVNNPNAISGGVASSYWLIGTFIPITGATNPDITNKADFAKIASVTGTVAPPTRSGVPEPSSLALAGLSIGTLGLVRRLRRRGQLR